MKRNFKTIFVFSVFQQMGAGFCDVKIVICFGLVFWLLLML